MKTIQERLNAKAKTELIRMLGEVFARFKKDSKLSEWDSIHLKKGDKTIAFKFSVIMAAIQTAAFENLKDKAQDIATDKFMARIKTMETRVDELRTAAFEDRKL